MDSCRGVFDEKIGTCLFVDSGVFVFHDFKSRSSIFGNIDGISIGTQEKSKHGQGSLFIIDYQYWILGFVTGQQNNVSESAE